jgi:predicted nuclease of predicted toxin-antitoxin system
MAEFVIDANLPYSISSWKNSRFVHLLDLNEEWSDSEVWQHAKQNQLTIITKDSDFSHRMMVSTPPPKVIHFRIGNMRLRELQAFINQHWSEIETLSKDHKLVIVYADLIEAI